MAVSIENLYQIYKKSTGVSTDTRNIQQGNIFFALKGPSFNANEFAEDALSKGAAYAVVDDQKVVKDERFLLVDNVLDTLQKLSRHHRRQFSIPFIAITGSNGKTTTKELVNTVLAAKYKTYATKGNLNNHIGIPLTLLSIATDTEIAIIEMGANHQQEIAGYCKIAEPTHGLITNIGKAHLEGFGGIEGVKKGKGELYDYLLETNGTAFVYSENEVLLSMSKFKEPIMYPGENDFYHCELVSADPFVKLKTENNNTVETALIGAYNYENIAAALCIGKYFKVPAQDAERAVASYVPQNNRSQIVEQGTNHIVLDAYNANPSSMKVAIQNFKKIAADKKIAILGDMLELGSESPAEHRAIGDLLKNAGFTKVFLCGPHMKEAAAVMPDAEYSEKRDALESKLKSLAPKHCHILIKGSRGMGLEKLLEVL
ncbi:UDP-N-acetylmuramoyl-tripeptide--D-alanyl-D-alanine ligase [Cytophagaceae bacterium ABcell3]|nr:UDP-N-acetylmuramoyl-tripeptide--D-alanyl-D-alanine ligase [Cytophagaceae bacterium ABcell3]